MNRDRRIFYLRDETGFPVACIATIPAVEATRNNPNQVLRVGFSSWNPMDVYNKKEARNKAIGRAHGSGAVLFERQPGVKVKVMEFISARPDVEGLSDAAIKAARLWLKGMKYRAQTEATLNWIANLGKDNAAMQQNPVFSASTVVFKPPTTGSTASLRPPHDIYEDAQ